MTKLKAELFSLTEYPSDAPVILRFALTNTTTERLSVLKWFTPLEGLNSKFLRVTWEGNPILYDGKLVKRGKPEARDYVLLRPGETISANIDLSRGYALSNEGSYRVELDTIAYGIFPIADEKELAFRAESLALESENEALTDAVAFFRITGQSSRTTSGEDARTAERQVETLRFEANELHHTTPDDATNLHAFGAKSPTTTGGNATQKAAAKQAHYDGYELCVDAISRLNDPAYTTWFGVFTVGRFAMVSNTYDAIKSGMENHNFTYDITGAGCQSNWLAYTYYQSKTIWLCQKFWTLPTTGADSQPGTVLHEHSHSASDTDDIAYGVAKCKALAVNHPDQAVKNADSFQYFAEEV